MCSRHGTQNKPSGHVCPHRLALPSKVDTSHSIVLTAEEPKFMEGMNTPARSHSSKVGCTALSGRTLLFTTNTNHSKQDALCLTARRLQNPPKALGGRPERNGVTGFSKLCQSQVLTLNAKSTVSPHSFPSVTPALLLCDLTVASGIQGTPRRESSRWDTEYEPSRIQFWGSQSPPCMLSDC